MRILKFSLEVVYEQSIEMPVGASILSVQPQRNRITMWAKSPEPNGEIRTFRVFATGDEVPDELSYVGTVKQFDDQFVWHVFEALS